MAKVEVELWAGLRPLADGKTKVSVKAKTIREMLEGLSEDYPGLKPIIEQGVSVIIDGEIHVDSVVEPVAPGQEIILMQRLAGG